MRKLARRTAIAIGGLALVFGLFWISVSAWTRHQLLADGPTTMCIHAEHVGRFRSGRWDTRYVLAVVALDHAYPPPHHWRASTWLLRSAAVTWLGFLFIGRDERIAMVLQLPRCPPRSLLH